MPSRVGSGKRPAAGRQRSRQASAKGSKGKSALSRAAREAVHEVLDVPHFSEERSLDSLEITAQMLKGSLNASFRDGEERLRGSANSKQTSDGDRRGSSRGGSDRGSGGKGGSDKGSSNGSGRSGGGDRGALVDVPHLDDIWRSAGEAKSVDRAVPAGGADAAGGAPAGGGGSLEPSGKSGPINGGGDGRNSTNPGALDASLGSGGSGSMSSSNTSRAGSQTSRASSSRRGKNGAIVIEDEESVGSSLWGSFSRRGPLELAQEDSASGRNIDAPNGSKKDRRGSWLFENLWGSAQNVNDGQGRHDLSDERRESDAFSGRSDESERRSMALVRTVSGRVGFRRSRTHGGESDECPPPRYYGSRCVNSCRGTMARYAKWTTVCIVGSVALAATIGALVAMVPLWMDSEERGESGELGGLAYGGEGEVAGSGKKGTLSGPEPAPADGAMADGNSASSSLASSALPPPPHDLQLLCSRASPSQPAEYEACLAACLPSRCCLVPADDPYEVWTMREGVDPKSSAPTGMHPAKDAPATGTTITSCFHEFPDACVHYYNQCAVLGASALLPRRPPTEEEAEGMDGRQKLELAERVNRACAKVRNGGDRSECRMLCAEKECCFAKNGEEEEKKTHAWHPALEESHGENETEDIPSDDALATDGFLETSHAEGPHDVDMAAQNYYGPGYGRHTPTAEPTSLAESIGDYPTLAGSSYRPTPTSTMLRRLAHTEVDEHGHALVHAEIPGEEDFAYVAERPNGSKDSTAAQASAHEEATPVVPDTGYREPGAVPTFKDEEEGHSKAGEASGKKNCVADPKKRCTTYAGCAPLFAK